MIVDFKLFLVYDRKQGMSKLLQKMSKIVCLGGGSAMPKAVLKGLKKYPVKLSVICAMLDSGGSAGKEREMYKTNVSFGDIRRAFLALSGSSQEVKDAFNIRFKDGQYLGLVIANVLGTAMVTQDGNYKGDYESVLKVYREVLKIPPQYEILPATLEDADVCAVLEGGQIVSGEKNIDKPRHDKKLKIKKVFLKPEPNAYPKAVNAILKSDLIVIGPGDLYSTLAQILLTKGVSEAVKKSKTKTVYICNLMTKDGETNGFSVIDFTDAIENLLGKKLDFVVYNTKKPETSAIKKHQKEYPELLDLVDFDENLKKDKKFIGADLLPQSGLVVHDSKKLAKIILNLCRQ
ncbi:MAG: uridine diphosphate-N-acetylglucosamine-binding protein YvcK [bacterium]|nr:uridine diphosphate-N-acetylglucosamine-binding protein YvcK [bacterium]